MNNRTHCDPRSVVAVWRPRSSAAEGVRAAAPRSRPAPP